MKSVKLGVKLNRYEQKQHVRENNHAKDSTTGSLKCGSKISLFSCPSLSGGKNMSDTENGSIVTYSKVERG